MTAIRIIIPSRYDSTRLPGKPLIKIAGIEMIQRVATIAASVCRENSDCDYVVATDDERIIRFCNENEIPAVMTPTECQSGTERCFMTLKDRAEKPELIVNLQGDNPLCPPQFISALIRTWRTNPDADVYTPGVQLSWDEYDRMIDDKKTTPYSGTTVLVDKNDNALAFSKSVLPMIRNVAKAKTAMPMSPVRRHIGLYAYTYRALEKYISLEPSVYEPGYIEGLEQMRFLENGMRIKVVPVDVQGRKTTAGVDSPEDVRRVEEILANTTISPLT